MAINPNFVFTDPVAANQALGMAQLESQAKQAQDRNIAAMLESQSRERSQRYATQSQMAERAADREVTRENYALHRDIISANQRLDHDKTRDAQTKERAKLQFATIIEKLNNNVGDPPTQRELEKLLQAGPDLTEDQKNAARSVRQDAYNAAKANAENSKRAAKNYTLELQGINKEKVPDTLALDKVYKRLDKDKDVIFDRSTGTVQPRYQVPREDFIPGQGRAAPPTASSINIGGVPTIGDMQARIGGAAPALPPTGAGLSALAQPPQLSGPIDLAGRMPAGSAGYDAYALMHPPRVADFAPPPPQQFGPPAFATMPPVYGAPGELYGPPNTPMPAPPRVSDLQSLRPDYIPMDDRYYPPQ